MFFLARMKVRGMVLTRSNGIRLEYGNGIAIELKRVNPLKDFPKVRGIPVIVQLEEFSANATAGFEEDELECQVIIEREPSVKILELFTNYDGEEENVFGEAVRVDRYRTASSYLPGSLVHTPGALKEFSSQIHREMVDIGARTVKVLRWRLNCTSPHHFHHGLNTYFSFDCQHWKALPIESGAYFEVARDIDFTPEQGDEIIAMVKCGEDEPLPHTLLREAWLHRGAAPRSALLIGVSALEIAVKQYIQNVVPEATWLVEKVPSPPVLNMLSEFIPTLEARCKIDGKVVVPDRNFMQLLKAAIAMRNSLTHTGNQKIDPEKLGEILDSIQDILWLLDYYTGREWALRYIRIKTRVAMGIDVTDVVT